MSQFSPVIGMPGIGTQATATPRNILAGNAQFRQNIPAGRIVSGVDSRDPGNTDQVSGAATAHVLRAGMLMGLLSNARAGKYAPSVFDVLASPLGDAQTTLTISAAGATELVRRVGSTGNLTLTGGLFPGGSARQFTVAYSAVNTTTGAVTITATGTGSVSGVNQINSAVTVDSTGSGTFTLTVEGITTAAITYSATIATLKANIQAQLDAVLGTNAIVAGGASLAALILTSSGTGYSGRPVGVITANLLAGSTGYTINGSGTIGTPSVCPVTTAGVVAVTGVGGEFIAGSLVGASDGSQLPTTILGSTYGWKVTDLSGNSTDTFCDELLLAGHVNVVNIVNYPTDTGIIAWLKTQLKSKATLTFSDDF